MKARFVNYYLNENYDLDWEDQDSGHTVNGKRMTNGEMLDWFRKYGEPGEIPPEFEERLGLRRRTWESVNEAYGQKDLTRMEDIKTKAGGDPEAEVKLATTQAKLINKGPKAAARAEAAEVVFGPDHPVAQIFRDKAAELGASVGQASKGVLAPVKGPAGKGERLEREWKKKKILPSERVGGEDAESGGSFGRGGDGDVFQKIGIGRFAKPPETSTEHEWRDASILPIGWVDLGSGESKYFNVYETWPDSTAEVWETPDGKYRLIFTAGTPSLKIGQTRDFRHDQTWKNIGRNWKFIDYLPVKDLLELVRVYGRAKFPGYTYK